MRNSLSAFIPAGLRADANKMLDVLGFGPNNFSVELSPPGSDTITIYGLHAVGSGRFNRALKGEMRLPQGERWRDHGLTKARVDIVVAAIKRRRREYRRGQAKENFRLGSVDEGVERKRYDLNNE